MSFLGRGRHIMSFCSKMEDIYVFLDFGRRHAFGDIFDISKRHMSFRNFWINVLLLYSVTLLFCLSFFENGGHIIMSFLILEGDMLLETFDLSKRHMSLSDLWMIFFAFIYIGLHFYSAFCEDKCLLLKIQLIL